MLRALSLVVLAVAAAACGGAREHASAPAAPTPSGPPPSAGVQLSIQHAIEGPWPAWAVPGALPAQAVSVADSAGRTLYFVPTRSVWCVALADASSVLSTACSPRDGSQPPLEASYTGDLRSQPSEPFVLYGWAAPSAGSVELRFADGRSQLLPLSQGFFLWAASGPLQSRPATLAALAADGSLVDERQLVDARVWEEIRSPPPPPPSLPPAPPASDHVDIELAGAAATLSINADGTCGGWTLAGDVGISESEVRFVTLGVDTSGGADDGGVLLSSLDDRPLIVGQTGAGATSAALVLSDGSEQSVPLHERCVLVALSSEDNTDALHPTALRWRDAGGTAHDAALDATWPTFLTDSR
jgi:hypothetical protein